MAKIKVLLTLRPDEPWEVDEDEVPTLRAEGLLLKVLDGDDEPEPAPEPAAIPPDVIIPDVPADGAEEGA